MARRRRRSRRRGGHRKNKSNLVRNLALALGITLPILWVVFSKTMFDPFEAPAPSFRLAVPRDVDLFAHRLALSSDLDLSSKEALPSPVIIQRWMRTLPWRDFAATDWARQRGVPATVEELYGSLGETVAMDTGPIDIVTDLLGKECAVIGRDPWTAGRFAFLFRLSTKAKVAVELLDFMGEGVLQGATRSEMVDELQPGHRWWRIDLQDGSSWHYFRHSDLLVVGNDGELVLDVQKTLAKNGELSLGLSRLYRDNVPEPMAAPDERFGTDFALDLQHLIHAYDLLPDEHRRDEDAISNVLPSLVDVERLRDAVGRLEFDKRRLDLDLFADVEGGALGATDARGGVIGSETFKVHERLGSALSLMPRGTAAVQVMNVDLSAFLKSVVEGLDPELVQLINDSIRGVANWTPTFNVHNVSQLIAELDRALTGHFTVAMRTLDHDIPAGAQPVPTLALIAPIRDLRAWEAIAQAVINGNQVLGIDSEEMWQQSFGGLGTHKFLPLPITSSEGVSWIVLEGETLVLSTDPDFTNDIIEAYSGRGQAVRGEPGVDRLLEAYQRQMVRANVAAWIDARSLMRIIEPYAEWRAELDTAIDFAVVRAQERRKILRAEYPGYVELPPPEQLEQAISERLDTLMDAMEAERLAITVPAAAQTFLESWGWMGLIKQGSFSLRLGEHTASASVHLETVID